MSQLHLQMYKKNPTTMEIYFLSNTFISEEDAKKLGSDIQDKIIRFRNKTKKACIIIGYEQDGNRCIDIITESHIDEHHKNMLFTYIVDSEVTSIMIGKNAICFHTPIL
jgi:hypothetical protein